MGTRVVFLPNFLLVLFLDKHKGVGTFLNQKKRIPNTRNLLNNSIEKQF